MSVYRITSGDLCYYGSTIQPIRTRFNRHKWNHANGVRHSVAVLFDRGECSVELVETVTGTVRELREREAWYIRNHPCVNKSVPLRTAKEWRALHKEHCYQLTKDWILNNHDRYLASLKRWRAEHPDYAKNRRINKDARASDLVGDGAVVAGDDA